MVRAIAVAHIGDRHCRAGPASRSTYAPTTRRSSWPTGSSSTWRGPAAGGASSGLTFGMQRARSLPQGSEPAGGRRVRRAGLGDLSPDGDRSLAMTWPCATQQHFETASRRVSRWAAILAVEPFGCHEHDLGPPRHLEDVWAPPGQGHSPFRVLVISLPAGRPVPG